MLLWIAEGIHHGSKVTWNNTSDYCDREFYSPCNLLSQDSSTGSLLPSLESRIVG